ncbi:MAG: histidine kinase [Kofleriaceae bacterium]
MGETDHELRSQFEEAQAITHIGTWRWELATGVVTWTDELYRIYGLAPRSATITLEFVLGRIHPGERDRIQGELDAALAHRGRFAYRELIVRPDGSVRTLDTMGEVHLDDAGNPAYLLGTCRDVTEEAHRDEALQFYADVFAHVQIGLSAWEFDRLHDPPQLRLAAFNAATESITRVALAHRIGDPITELFPEFAGVALAALACRIFDILDNRVDHLPEVPITTSSGTRTLSVTLFGLPNGRIGLALEDVTTVARARLVARGEQRALEMLAAGAPIADTLAVVVEAIEQATDGIIASILVIDETGTRLRHGAAPRLPRSYQDAVDGTVIGPAAGSCGTAAFRREPVYVADTMVDPLWAGYRELVVELDLRACWSSPILATDGGVLGTFALYRREPGVPDDATRALMSRAAHVAALVLERRALDEQLRALASRIEAIREDERTTIAREIHDELGQALTALKLDIGWLARRVHDEPLDQKLGEMSRATDDVIRSVRRISTDLRPGILDQLGLHAAIEWQAEEFTRRTGTPCELTSGLGPLVLERDLATAIFRIFQEALTNITRHASAHRVEVRIQLEQGRIELEVADDGIGIPEVGPRGQTLGILGMGERARRLGGACTVKRRTPRGTVVAVSIALRFPAGQLAGRSG